MRYTTTPVTFSHSYFRVPPTPSVDKWAQVSKFSYAVGVTTHVFKGKWLNNGYIGITSEKKNCWDVYLRVQTIGCYLWKHQKVHYTTPRRPPSCVTHFCSYAVAIF